MSATSERSTPPQRSTRQRRALTALLGETDDFHSAQELHEILRGRGETMGMATVYRLLNAMADAGDLDVLNHSGEAIYRRCSTEHHHHLVCRQCGRTVEVAGPAVERWTQSIASDHGFSDVSHTLELFGLCPACQGS